MKTITSEKQRQEIQEFIQTELLKRGFHAPITALQEKTINHNTGLYFESAPFQTTPVLFKSIKIINFANSILDEEPIGENSSYVPDLMIRRVYIQVYVEYKHFDGGSNGSKLFGVQCFLNGDDVFELMVH